MKIEDIKKVILNTKPTAVFLKMKNSTMYYRTKIRTNTRIPMDLQVFFEIPINDVTDSVLDDKMDSNYLVEWIVV
jgi:hypothetical protein